MSTLLIVGKKNQKLALRLRAEDIAEGLSFFSDDRDFIQVGTWRYEKGKRLLTHTHNFVKREVTRTQEFIYVVKGSVKASIYDEDEEFLEDLTLNPNEGLILFSGGHGYEMLEGDTVVIEVKNGPYPGAGADRKGLEGE
ncbi:MAG: cupin domain-containing protein [Planctomycetota bacterium]|jgi:hypothetical protein